MQVLQKQKQRLSKITLPWFLRTNLAIRIHLINERKEELKRSKSIDSGRTKLRKCFEQRHADSIQAVRHIENKIVQKKIETDHILALRLLHTAKNGDYY